MSNAGRVIVNVSHINHTIYEGPMGRYVVDGRGQPGAETGRFSVFVVPEKLQYAEDRGWGEPGPENPRGRRIVPVDGCALAKEIVDAYVMNLGKLPDDKTRIRLGLFLAAGDQPTEEELTKAETSYLAELQFYVDQGNGAWDRGHNVRTVDGKAKLAARVLGIETPWAASAFRLRQVECPGCGQMVSPKLAVHRRTSEGEECGYVFDMEKAKRMIGVQIPLAVKQPEPDRAAKRL